MSTLFNDWLDYFDSSESSTKINQSKLEELFKNFNSLVDDANIRSRLEKCDQTVFLAKLANHNSLAMFHHFSQIGDSLYSDTSDSGFIIGVERNLEAESIVESH